MIHHHLGPFTEETWLSFKLDNFAKHLSHGDANMNMINSMNLDHMYVVKSDPIQVGGVQLEIRLYPKDRDMDVYLYLLDDVEAVKKFSFILLSTYDSPTSYWKTNNSGECDGFEPKTGLGFVFNEPMVQIGWVDRNTTNSMDRDKKDCVWFKLGLQVESSKMVPSSVHPAAGSPRKEEPDQSSKASPHSGNNVMGTLLVNGDFADVTFDVHGQTFAAHRCVLAARSSVFRSELIALKNDTSKSDVCVLVKYTDARTFNYLLHFIYTDSLHPDFNNEVISSQTYVPLFIAAHHFDVEGLKSICAEKLPKGTADVLISTLKITEDRSSGLLEVVKKG